MDELGSFAQDPILPLQRDQDSDFGGFSADDTRGRQNSFSMTGSENGSESNEILRNIFDEEHPRNSHQNFHQSSSEGPSTLRSHDSQEYVDILVDDGDGGENDNSSSQVVSNPMKRQRIEAVTSQVSPSVASYASRNIHMPHWMVNNASSQPTANNTSAAPRRAFGASVPNGYRRAVAPPAVPINVRPVPPAIETRQHKPNELEIPEDYVSTWESPLPVHLYRRPRGRRRYELSLVNVKEFTITGLPVSYEGPPSSLDGLRKKIKELSKDHGKATYERNKDGSNGRWRIPLGAYSAFYTYLTSDPLVQVIGIPQEQLKIASLGKARLERGYPSVKKLVSMGVPRGLATALAPFQRGGVDFVIDKGGRALIADEMGLGKTVQGIASMSVYHQDWPILVLTPSSARYHWENEFQHWLGRDSLINTQKQTRVNLGGESDEQSEDEGDTLDESRCMRLLGNDQIHVLSSGKDPIIPSRKTKVVICSYGLAPALAASGKLTPGIFRAAIVDESHMLKNMNTKRTKFLVPVLHATHRCVLLSGTPALSKPSELWPQLKILSTEQSGWWEEESVFYEKYVKNSSIVRRAELHAMLTGTVMIRRLKNDILKSLPKKSRSKAVVDVCTPSMRTEFHRCMLMLRQGKGQLGKLARQYSALGPVAEASAGEGPNGCSPEINVELEKAKAAIQQERDAKLASRMQEIDFAISNSGTSLSQSELKEYRVQMAQAVQNELQVWYNERIHELQEEFPQGNGAELSRKSVLNRMYSLTGKSKLALISSMLKKWLSDPTKGKLCIFAHHIFVLDEIVRLSKLSNRCESKSQYIRIDGSTSPKERQAQIKKFQTDPNVRIAVLGITAAGVAVTLTASSTVWFTELFWTPALMIQAEDRCHRIGQNARVQCLYFVASGTLDDLLWKLLEKKFRDLGEFVEGMEKQKIVVHKTYHGTKELDGIFDSADGENSDEEADLDQEASDDEGEGRAILSLQNDLQRDIELLGKEELSMIKNDGEDDEVVEDSETLDGKAEPVSGTTEEDAITLSDDEGASPATESEPNKKSAGEKKEPRNAEPLPDANTSTGVNVRNQQESVQQAVPLFDLGKPLRGCRAYSVLFEGNSFGMQLFIHEGRIVIGRLINPQHDRPELFDVMIAVNGQRMPMIEQLSQITNFLKLSISRGPVEIIFASIPDLKANLMELSRQHEEKKKQLALRTTPCPSGDVIDLVDDD